jgi:predicted small secreted protein
MVTRGFGDHDAGMNSSLRRLAVLLLTAAFLALVVTGCQTTKGFGKDVKNLGDKIEDKAGP